jgi:transposase
MFELWAQDEHRIGLKPLIRRGWAKQGQRPSVPVNHRFQWLYVYGFVHPESGSLFLPLCPKVNTEQFGQTLQAFAQQVGAGAEKRVLLLLDRAGWHRSKKLILPEGIHPLWLPPYSPELQPAEHLWPLTNEGIANECFETLDALIAKQRQRCEILQSRPALIRQNTCFHWWPTHINDS